MSDLRLAPPDWNALLGGTQEEAAWIADRNRKFGLAAEKAGVFLEIANRLEAEGLLFQCTPGILQEMPAAADWYVSLAGFSMKTLQNIVRGPTNYGLARRVKGLVEGLRHGRAVPDGQLVGFSAWVNSEIDTLFPPDERSRDLALATVFMILGGRNIGQGQNLGGNEAVDLLKSLIVEGFEKRDRRVEVQTREDAWEEYRPEHNLPQRQRIRIGGRMIFEFISGGDRPDIIIFLNGVRIAVGEVKGRKDLSNVWESWMPGVYNHLRTWTGENPDASRLFFGTLISESMIEGASTHGTQNVGLKTLHRQGLLTTAYNISKVAENDPDAERRFEEFVEALDGLLPSEETNV